MRSLDYAALSTLAIQSGIIFVFLASGCYLSMVFFRAWRIRSNNWTNRFSVISDMDNLVPGDNKKTSAVLISSQQRAMRASKHKFLESDWLKWCHVICACFVALIGFIFPDTIVVVFILLVLLSIIWAVHWGLRCLQRRRKALFLKQLPEAVDIIVRGAQLGKSIAQNLAIVGGEMPSPAGRVFQNLAHQLNLGKDLEASLATIREVSKIKEMQFLATILTLQKEFGGQYAKILENLSLLLRDRQAHDLKTKALTSETRLSAKIISVVTVIVVAVLAITSDTQLDFLLHDPVGRLLFLYCLVSNGIGLVSISFLLGSDK